MLGPIEDALNDPSSSALNAVQRDRIDLAHRSSLRLLKLVNSLLDFSRMEAGRVRASFQPTDLAAFTAEVASNFESAIDRAGLKLRIKCPPLRAPIYVDREMWEKIVLNLISNSFKFTFEGEIAIEVRRADSEASAELVIRDTGTGIPKYELPHLFERFHRIEGAKGRTFEGSGIGLALVHELVKQHGGSICVESEVDAGTTFTISIPFGTWHLPRDRIVMGAPHSSSARAEAYVQEALRWLPESSQSSELAGAPASDDLSEDVGAARGNGERVLLVDDNADMRAYIRRLLVAQGFAVEAVGDGEGALVAARRDRPDLVLSDVMMPGLDGFGLLAELRGDGNLLEIPIILLSARAGEEARVEGLEAGADDYISKPFSARELLARVRANLQLARIRRDAKEAQRQYAARLEAVVNTVPTAVWFTHDPNAERIFGNAYGARLLGLPQDANVSLFASVNERRSYRIIHNGKELLSTELPLHRAVRGEIVRDEELEIRFEGGQSITLVCHAAPIRAPGGDIQGAVCGAIDITDRKRQERHRDLLINELNHRVKNTLATVQSFAMQTLRNATTVAEGRKAFDSRLIALSKAHDVLVREHWEGAGLREVVGEALAAYSENRRKSRLRFDGPELRLQPKAALAVSMALHELATNAVKYGALSNDTGKVQIRWTVENEARDFHFRWSESGGPLVVVPRKRGFGSRLIEQGLSQDLAAQVRLEFEEDGVVCTIKAPLDEVRAGLGFGRSPLDALEGC
jgi:two-component sensor histidine kinase/CheY-like chemotaxis protein